jgi:phage tail-like protein
MAEAKVHDPAVAFQFEVQARGANVGFSKVSGLREENEVIEYREGTDPTTVRKIPGLRSYPALVFERGMTAQGTELLAWREDVIACGEGFRATVNILIKNCDGSPARTVTFEQAWPNALELSDLDASASEVSIETMELMHEGRVSSSIFVKP